MKTVVHVHQQRIKANAKQGKDNPPIIVRTYKGVAHGKTVEIRLPDGTVVATLVYRPKPLSCGARCWLETNLDVVVVD